MNLRDRSLDTLTLFFVSLSLTFGACADKPAPPAEDTPPSPSPVTFIDPPAGADALAANWRVGDGVALSWLEPHGEGHVMKVAQLAGNSWSEPETIVTDSGFFANWADLPAVAVDGSGTEYAHWLQKLGDGTYAYGAHLATRVAGGSWTTQGLLHEDASPSEHGFVSYVPLSGGGVRSFWLDGGKMGPGGDHGHESGGAMELRTRLLDADGRGKGAETVLDPKVCECCATDAAWTSRGPLVVFRDRSDDEIRDIYVVRQDGDGWTEPVPVFDDGWQINGCPVNGPAVAAVDDRVAVVWFTASPEPRVQIAFSDDAGATFAAPQVVDGEWPVGRVDVAMDASGRAVVAWMGTVEGGAEIRWRVFDPDGPQGPVGIAAPTTEKRSSGVTRMQLDGDRLLFAWIADGETRRLRVGAVPLVSP